MPKQAAIQIGEPAAAPVAAALAAPALEPITPLLAAANVQARQQLAQRQCASCHSFDEGGRPSIRRDLYGIIGAKHAHIEGFDSAAIRAMANKPWTYEDMNTWIANPRAYARATRCPMPAWRVCRTART
jgi:cytochrome c